VNFSANGKRRFNDLRANFVREIPRKEFFNTHIPLRSVRGSEVCVLSAELRNRKILFPSVRNTLLSVSNGHAIVADI
jgi:hypothetical protein